MSCAPSNQSFIFFYSVNTRVTFFFYQFKKYTAVMIRRIDKVKIDVLHKELNMEVTFAIFLKKKPKSIHFKTYGVISVFKPRYFPMLYLHPPFIFFIYPIFHR